jgi:hypothetical protein
MVAMIIMINQTGTKIHIVLLRRHYLVSRDLIIDNQRQNRTLFTFTWIKPDPDELGYLEFSSLRQHGRKFL